MRRRRHSACPAGSFCSLSAASCGASAREWAIVAGGLSRTQDLGAFLRVLLAAVRRHGAPEGLVTDGGSIFRAKHPLTVLDRLGVVKHEIAWPQAWLNSIEANVGIQRRLADWGFGRAGSRPESNRYNEARGRFIGWLHKNAYEDGSNPLDWVEVWFDEEGKSEVTSHNPYVV